MHVDGKALVDRWGLWGIFLLSFLSATLLPGVSEVGLAGLVASGRFRPWPLIWSASVGNFLGGVVTYFMGWALGMDALAEWLGISAESVEGVRDWVEDYGAWCGLLIWTPVFGDPLAAALGLAHSPIVGTFTAMFIGKAARYVFIVFLADWVTVKIKEFVRARKERSKPDKSNV